MEGFRVSCDYESVRAINTLLKEDRFVHVRNMIVCDTPFGGFLDMDFRHFCPRNFLGFNMVKLWNGEKLIIGSKEFEIDEELVTRFISFSASGNEIIEPKKGCMDPSFLKEPVPNWKYSNKKFHSQLISMFGAKDDPVVMDAPEVLTLCKSYVLLLFSALLFPMHNRAPREYFFLVHECHFSNIKSYRFDLEIAKFLERSIQDAKKSKSKRVYVNGFVHIIQSLFLQESVIVIPSKHNRRENKEDGNAASVMDTVVVDSVAEKLTATILEKPKQDEKKKGQAENADNSKRNKKKKRSADNAANLKATIEEPPKLEKVADKKERKKKKKKMRKADTDDSVSENLGATTEEGLGLNQEDGEEEENDYTLSGIRTTIDDMRCTRFCDMSPEMIVFWEKNITNAEKLGFNFPQLRNWWERCKRQFLAVFEIHAKMDEQDNIIEALEKALKEAEDKRFCDMSPEMIVVWEKNIMNAEKLGFNFPQLHNWWERCKKNFLEAAMDEQDNIIEALKKALKEAEDTKKTLIKEFNEYPLYGNGHSPLSEWC